jgi:hypothetical protein
MGRTLACAAKLGLMALELSSHWLARAAGVHQILEQQGALEKPKGQRRWWRRATATALFWCCSVLDLLVGDWVSFCSNYFGVVRVCKPTFCGDACGGCKIVLTSALSHAAAGQGKHQH